MTSARLVLGCSVLFVACAGSPPDVSVSEEGATRHPAVEPPPQSYCDALQSTLERAARQAGLSDSLRCLDTPGISEIGTYGPEGRHDANHLGNCFPDAESAARVIDRSPPFQLGFELERTVDLSAGGGLDLTAVAAWLPSITAGSESTGSVRVRMTIEDAHFRTVTNLASNLRQHRNAAQCIAELCRDDHVYTHKSLVGTVVLQVTGSAAQSLRASASLTGALGFEVEHGEGDRAEMVMRSAQPLTVAASFVPSKSILDPSGVCANCGAPDQPCCAGETCNAGGLCREGACQACGRATQPCCAGQCDEGSFCYRGSCEDACGLSGERCCDRRACAEGLSCTVAEAPRVEESVLRTEEEVSGGLFGTSENRNYGGACGPDRLRSGMRTTKLSGEGNCDRVWWTTRNDPADCRVSVHYGIPSLESVRCRIEVFATRPGAPERAPEPTCR